MTHLESASSVQRKPAVPIFNAAGQRTLPGRRTVLLAEDDEDLRCVMACTLRAMGYDVVACADAQLASAAFRSHGYIDVLLTDFQMPGKTGVELARELTDLSPTLPVMIITGSILPASTMREMDSRHWLYISKPCNLLTLETTLKRITSVWLPAA